jgi:hypothetical protein
MKKSPGVTDPSLNLFGEAYSKAVLGDAEKGFSTFLAIKLLFSRFLTCAKAVSSRSNFHLFIL